MAASSATPAKAVNVTQRRDADSDDEEAAGFRLADRCKGELRPEGLSGTDSPFGDLEGVWTDSD